MTYKEYREEDVLYIFELFMGHLRLVNGFQINVCC